VSPRFQTDRHQELTAYYEELRKDALASGSQHAIMPEFGLFLKNGMTAWMQAWSPCMRNAATKTTPDSNLPTIAPDSATDIRTTIASILAGIILSQPREAIT